MAEVTPARTSKDRLDALAKAASCAGRAPVTLESIAASISKIIEPWLGVRADILPKSICQLAAVSNDIQTLLREGKQPPETAARESGWLIERNDMSHSPQYLRLMASGVLWVLDASTALRFSRKDDADAFMWYRRLDLVPQAVAVEHAWCAPTTGAS